MLTATGICSSINCLRIFNANKFHTSISVILSGFLIVTYLSVQYFFIRKLVSALFTTIGGAGITKLALSMYTQSAWLNNARNFLNSPSCPRL